MESLIKFRLLTSQLTPTEKESFIKTLLSTFGSDFIITSIFDHFTKCILKLQSVPCHQNQLNDLIQMTSTIIESRNEFPSIYCNQSLKLHQLPPELIGKTSSFLNTNDYLTFQRVNRDIYIGSNSPCKLQKFEVLFYQDEIADMINWSKYSSILSLGEVIFPDIIHIIKPFDLQIKFDMLHELVIGFNMSSIKENDVEQFLSLKSIHFSKIHRLSIRYIGDENNHIYGSPSLLFKLLSAFSNLKYLELHGIHLFDGDYADYQDSKILHLFPNIQGIKVTLCDELLSKRLVELYAQQIQLLICDSVIEQMTIPKLPKLHSLAIDDCNLQPSTFHDLIKGANVLQKIKIGMDLFTLYYEHIVTSIITIPQNINYIEITSNYLKFNKLCELIETTFLFSKAKHEHKKKLKIKFDLWLSVEVVNESINWKQIVLSTKRVIDTFNNLEIKDFMVCCSIQEWSEEIKRCAKSIFDLERYTVNCHDQDQIFVVSKMNSQLSYQDELYMFLD